jgi:hypothetical protein
MLKALPPLSPLEARSQVDEFTRLTGRTYAGKFSDGHEIYLESCSQIEWINLCTMDAIRHISC